MTNLNDIPDEGYLRIGQILGNPKADPPTAGLIPIHPASWWRGIAAGRYPKPVSLGPNTTAWKVRDIKELIARIDSGSKAV
jgi:prophage regulatory protein